MEIWKSIKNYEGLYEVSSFGRIKSMKRLINRSVKGIVLKEEKIISQSKRGDYLKVSLSKNSKIRQISVHRLVAEAFIPNPENKKTVNHINEIKTDNRAVNLEWCTQKENIWHSANIKKVYRYTLDGNLDKSYKCSYYSKEEGFSPSLVNLCCKKKKRLHKGYFWSYNDNETLDSLSIKNTDRIQKKVYQYDLCGSLIKEWNSVKECVKKGYKQSNISSCCLGKRKTHKGFVWRYDQMQNDVEQNKNWL